MAAYPIVLDEIGYGAAPGRSAEAKSATTKAQAIQGQIPPAMQPRFEPDYLQDAPQPMSQGTSVISLGARSLDNLGSILKLLDSTAAGEEEDNPSTLYAYLNSRSVVEAAYVSLLAEKKKNKNLALPDTPAPIVSTDDVGGIRIVWRAGRKQLRANFGAREDSRSYLYFESGLDHDVEALQPGTLSERLRWLFAR